MHQISSGDSGTQNKPAFREHKTLGDNIVLLLEMQFILSFLFCIVILWKTIKCILEILLRLFKFLLSLFKILFQATMIYAGFYTEILSCNPLNPIKLTMVSPSAGNRQLAKDCSPSNPMLINDRCDSFLEKHKLKYNKV